MKQSSNVRLVMKCLRKVDALVENCHYLLPSDSQVHEELEGTDCWHRFNCRVCVREELDELSAPENNVDFDFHFDFDFVDFVNDKNPQDWENVCNNVLDNFDANLLA